MRNTLLILLIVGASLATPALAPAQAVTAKTTAVMADPATGVVVWPANFWSANAASLPSPTPPWSAIIEKPTTLAGYGITDAATKTYVEARTPPPVAARITIQLDAGQTDAELKLAIDNYISGILVLWIHTPNPKGGYITGQIVPPGTRVYYTDSGRSDTRTHRALDWTSELGIAYQKSTNGQVGSIVFIIPASATIRPDNPALAWVYHRMWTGGHEQDAAGHAIWRIPDKVEWLTVMPSY
ncbi:MAG: hypothetical protein LBK99_00440 [Opitutaceae bacterium]|jgi:hypothetical protein|nr:hypothetical protein [Opitutaceae bacterium]